MEYRNYMRLLLLVVLFSVISFFSNAQEEEQTYNKQFGMHAGSTTGVGFSYREWSNNFGIQFTGIYGKKEDEFGSIGITLMRSIKKSDYTHFYWYLGNSLYYSKDSYSNKGETFYDIGSGPGISFGKVVQFNLMFGYGIYDVMDNFYIYPAGEIGLYYCF